MTNMRNVIAEADGYELVKYVTGESRIEHPASQTCSIWLHHEEEAEILSNPSVMSEWALDEDMGEEETEEDHADPIAQIIRATNNIARYLGHGCRVKDRKALAKCRSFAEFWELQKEAGLAYNKTAGDLPGIPCWAPSPTPESLKRAADALFPIVWTAAARAVLPRPEPRRTCSADYRRDFFQEWVDEMLSEIVSLLPVTEVGGVRHETATGRLMIEANPQGIKIEVWAGPCPSEPGTKGRHVLSATYVPADGGGWTVTLNIEDYSLIIPRRTEILMDIDKWVFGGALRRHCESKPSHDDARLLLQEPETDESED